MQENQAYYNRPLPLEIDDFLPDDFYDSEIIDYLNSQAGEEASPAVYSKSEFSALRQSSWYPERLKSLRFNAKDIRADLNFSDVLLNYAEFLNHSYTGIIDKSLLRCELRQVLKNYHKLLAQQAQQHFPRRNEYYEHRRSCPQQEQRYLDRDKSDPLIFENAPAAQILNGVANEALFNSRIKKFAERVKQYCRQNSLSHLNTYDFLPTSLLIGRIWAIKKVYHHWLDGGYYSLPESISLIELANRQVHNDLHHPPAGNFSECSYYQLYGSFSCILEDERRLRQHDLNQKARSMASQP